MKPCRMLFAVLVLIFFFATAQAATYDATGRWNFRIYKHENDCPGEPPESEDTGTVVLMQDQNHFLLVVE